MDPISVLGVAAASLQITEFTVKGICKTMAFLKDLEQKPNELEELLVDTDKWVHRFTHLKHAIQLPSPNPLHQLSPPQLLALESSVDDGLRATTGLQILLEPVIVSLDSVRNRRTKIWRAVISKRLEPDVKQQLERIKRQNNHIMREFHYSNLDLQIQQSQTIHRVLAVVESCRSAGETVKIELQTLSNSVQHISSTGASTAVQLDNVSTMMDDLATKTASLAITMGGFDTTVQSLDSNLTSEARATREEIIALRNDILPLILGQKSRPSNLVDNGATVKLSDLDKADLTNLIRQTLLSDHRSLRDACDSQTIQIVSAAASRQSCKLHGRRRPLSSTFLGFLSIEYENQPSRCSACQQTRTSSSRRLRLALQLLPFLNKTVEFNFGATFRGGGFHIESPLRVFSTVRRSESAVFQLFDGFVERCGANTAESSIWSHKWMVKDKAAGMGINLVPGYDWDIDAVKTELQFVNQCLSEIHKTGRGSIDDKDESGHTVLHEIVMIVGLLAPIYSSVMEEVNGLLRLAERSSVDMDAIADQRNEARRYSVFELSGRSLVNPLRQWTASQGAQALVRMFHQQYGNFYFLSRVSQLCAIETGVIQETPRIYRDLQQNDISLYPVNLRSSLLTCLLREHWLAPCFADDELLLILLTRNLDSLKKIVSESTLTEEYIGELPLQVLDLAIGWPEGLRTLASVWKGNVTNAIELATSRGEWESLLVLYQYPVPLFTSIEDMHTFISSLLVLGRVLIDEVKRRRIDLVELACKFLSEADKDRFRLRDSATLDAQAWTVYQTLLQRDIPVPAALDPGPDGSIFHYVAHTYTESGYNWRGLNVLRSLEHLFDMGFRDLDHRGRVSGFDSSSTPLEWILTNSNFKNTHWAPICTWFLRRGASPTFSESSRIRNVLFGIARCLGMLEEGQFARSEASKPLRLLTRYAAKRCSPTEPDSCDCFCSSSGCLPLHFLCHSHSPKLGTSRWQCRQSQVFRLWSWIKTCEISDQDQKLYLEESVRLELFNRLDMRHTCCRAGYEKDDLDRSEIQQESEELNTQLELLMRAYRTSRDGQGPDIFSSLASASIPSCQCDDEEIYWPTSELTVSDAFGHQEWWLWKARQLLPVDRSATPWVHVHYDNLEQQYAEVESQRLKQLGYEGLEFFTVIQQHFASDLNMDEVILPQDTRNPFVPKIRTELMVLGLIWAFVEDEGQPWVWLMEEAKGMTTEDGNPIIQFV